MALKRICLLASACLAATNNDFSSLITSVESELNDLSQAVNAWSIERGIVGALRIQNSVQPLVGNVNKLKTAAQSVTAAEVAPAQLQSLSQAIVGVLQSLAKKESDFTRTGVRQIVANDIRDLEAPTAAIIGDLVTSLKSDCNKLEVLAPLIPQISGAFTAADTAYGGQPVQFPVAPACHRRAIFADPAPASPLNAPSVALAPSAALFAPVVPVVAVSSASKETVTVTHFSCPPTARPSPTLPALNKTVNVSADNSSAPRAPVLSNLLVSVSNSTDQNITQFIPVLSNGSPGVSARMGFVAGGIVVAAGLLM